MMVRKVLLSLPACLLLAHSSTIQAGTPLFDSEEPIKAVLSAPIVTTYRQKKQDVRLYQSGELTYKISNGESRKLPVKIRTRGNYRRLNCAHPPLRLNFAKKDTKGTLFKGQDKLKLVGSCQGGNAYQQYVGLEYLAYKIWQLISPHHFKTRLIELSYIDSEKKRKPWSRTTFVIEDIADVAKRAQKVQYKKPKVEPKQMDFKATALLEMFQLLIANTDYSTLMGPGKEPCCHNARLLGNKGANRGFIPVPYDFDVSGFVDAPYASPAAQYPINKVRQRYFSGWCKNPTHFEQAAKHIVSLKDQIYALTADAPILTDSSKRKTERYLAKYFEILESPDRMEKLVINRCRGKMVSG